MTPTTPGPKDAGLRALARGALALDPNDAENALYQLCELWWLARRNAPAAAVPPPHDARTEPEQRKPDAQPPRAEPEAPKAESPPPPRAETPPAPTSPTRPDGGADDGARSGVEEVVAVPVARDGRFRREAATPTTLHGAPVLGMRLKLERAFRGIKRRRVTASSGDEPDIEAIVECRAAARVWLPLRRRRRDRWLDLIVVTEQSATMRLWQATANEFGRLAARGSMARKTTPLELSWRTETGKVADGVLRLRNAGREYDRLPLVSRHSIVFFLTDAFGPGWLSGAIPTQLGRWAKTNPVLVVALLPAPFWNRTSFSNALPLAHYGGSRGLYATDALPPAPLLTYLEPASLERAIDVLGGRSRGDAMTLWRGTRPTDFADRHFTSLPSTPPTLGHEKIEALYQLFRETATPATRRLARYLADAPLILPVMRLIERALVPESAPWQLSELVMSGLLRRVDGVGNSLGETEYEFLPGVPERLRSEATAATARRVADVLAAAPERLREYIDTRLSRGKELPAMRVPAQARDDHGQLAEVPGLRQASTSPVDSGPSWPGILWHEAPVVDARFTPRKRAIVTATRHETFAVWDAATGKASNDVKWRPRGDNLMTESIRFSRDGSLYATITVLGDAHLWNARTGRIVLGVAALKLMEKATSVDFNHDASRIVVAYANGSAWTSLIDDDSQGVYELHHEAAITSARFSRDGTTILTTSKDGTARIWHLPGGICLRVLAYGVDIPIVAGDLSPDGTTVVMAAGDFALSLWSVASGEQIGRSMWHGGTITSVEFSPDGAWILSAGTDGTARVFDVSTQKELGEPLRHGDVVNAAGFSPDGRRIVTASSDRTARVWTTRAFKTPGTPNRQRIVVGHLGRVHMARFSSDGKRIVTAGGDGTARLWDAQTAQPLGPPLEEHTCVYCAEFSPDGTQVAMATWGTGASLWDTRERVRTVLVPRGRVYGARFSPGGTRVVTAGEDGYARLWSSRGKAIGDPMRHGGKVLSARFSVDGALVATASGDHSAHLWDAQTGMPIGGPLRHASLLYSAAFSPAGDCLLTCSGDGIARLWRVADSTARLWHVPAAGQGVYWKPLDAISMVHDERILSAEFSPGGALVVTASGDGTAQVWDTHSGEPVGPRLQHGAAVKHAEFSPDGELVVTASVDRTARFWHARTGTPIGEPMRHDGAVLSARFSPDGTRMVTASRDGTAAIWIVPTPDDFKSR